VTGGPKRCSHEGCKLLAEEGSDLCILHQPTPKDVERFKTALYAQLDEQGPEEERNRRFWFEGYVFPVEVVVGESRDEESDERVALPVRMEDADFSDAKFSGAAFSDATFELADFRGAKFAGAAFFRGAKFAGAAFFLGAKFAGDAYFRDATFEGFAYFTGTTFEGFAYFTGTKFSGAAFSDATFKRADFRGAKFAGDASFLDATFEGFAYFTGTKFAGDASFSDAKFSGAAFSDATFEWADFRGAKFSGAAFFRGAKFAGDADFLATEARDLYLGTGNPHVRGWGHARCGVRLEDWSSAPSFWRFAQRTYSAIGEREKADAAFYFARVAERKAQRAVNWPSHEGIRRCGRVPWLMKCLLRMIPKTWPTLVWVVECVFVRWTTAYGASLARLFIAWAFVVGSFGAAYSLAPSLIGNGPNIWSLRNWVVGLHFSVTTFTTLGLGALDSDRLVARVLISVEAILGAVLVALAVLVIGRRYMRQS